MGGGKKATKAPNYSAQIDRANRTADEQLRLGREQYEWGKQQDLYNRGILDQTLGISLPAAREQAANATEDRARYEDKFIPLEDRMIEDANTYDSAERRNKQSGMAQADVAASFEAARKNALSRLEGYGVDPSQTRNAALDIGVRTQQAAAQAKAASDSDNRVEDRAYDMRANAANLGRDLKSSAQTGLNSAAGIGNSMVGAATDTTASGAVARTSGLGFTGAGMSANNQAVNTMNTQFSNQVQSDQMSNANKANTWSTGAGIAGMAMGMSDGGKVGPRTALPMGRDLTLEAADRHISDTYGASESNTRSKVLPRALPPPMRAAIPITPHGSAPPLGGAAPSYHAPNTSMTQPLMFADGGDPGMVDQGMTDGTGIDDQVPANLSVGEYVIPADVVAAKGKEFFDKLLGKYHTPAKQQQAQMGAR